jgi:hypothetical protein
MNNDTEELDKLKLPKVAPKSNDEKDLIKTYLYDGLEEKFNVQDINNNNFKRKIVITVIVGGILVFLSSSYYGSIASRFLPEGGYVQEIARISLIFFLIGATIFFC